MKKLIILFVLSVFVLSCGKESPVVAEPVITFTVNVNAGVGGGVSSPGGS